jgi:hypothetical protein
VCHGGDCVCHGGTVCTPLTFADIECESIACDARVVWLSWRWRMCYVISRHESASHHQYCSSFVSGGEMGSPETSSQCQMQSFRFPPVMADELRPR